MTKITPRDLLKWVRGLLTGVAGQCSLKARENMEITQFRSLLGRKQVRVNFHCINTL